MVVASGLTVMLAETAPVLHEYVPPPLAVNVVLAPLQIEILAGEMVAVGFGLTVTNLEAVAVQEPPSVTVTE